MRDLFYYRIIVCNEKYSRFSNSKMYKWSSLTFEEDFCSLLVQLSWPLSNIRHTVGPPSKNVNLTWNLFDSNCNFVSPLPPSQWHTWWHFWWLWWWRRKPRYCKSSSWWNRNWNLWKGMNIFSPWLEIVFTTFVTLS